MLSTDALFLQNTWLVKVINRKDADRRRYARLQLYLSPSRDKQEPHSFCPSTIWMSLSQGNI